MAGDEGNRKEKGAYRIRLGEPGAPPSPPPAEAPPPLEAPPSGPQREAPPPVDAPPAGGPAAPSLPGYTLQRLLGAGTFGEVWSAVQLSTGQQVAVKILRRPMAGDLAYMEREVSRLVSVAEHPHVVAILDANLAHSPPFLVTPLLAGSLDDFVGHAADDVGKVGVEKVAAWFESLALALSYVHRKGILHCDLKPANVLMDHEGTLKVVDFGQSRAKGEEGISLGTFWYMPPEQAQISLDGAALTVPDVAWDIYALGAMMYQVLTGRLPRCTDKAQRVLSEESGTLACLARYRELVLKTPLVSVPSHNRKVDSELAAIVEHCLAVDPARRYRGMEEVLEDLRRRRARFPLMARPRTAGYVLACFLRRNARIVATAALAFALIVTNLTVSFIRITEARNEAVRARDEAVRARDEARRRLGGMEFERGVRLAENGDPAGVLWIADAVGLDDVAEFRSVAQNFLRARARLRTVVEGNACFAACASPDLASLAVASPDGNAVRILDAATGEERAALVHPRQVCAAAFSADGTRVCTISEGDVVTVWSVPAKEMLVTVRTKGQPADAAISPDGGRIAVAEFRDVSVYDVSSGARVAALSTGSRNVTAVAFSPDGRRIVTAGRAGVRIWSAASGRPECEPLKGVGEVARSSFSPDGRRVVTAGDDGARVWDAATGRPLSLPLPCGGRAAFAAFSPDGTRVVTACGSAVRIWDASTAEPLMPSLACGALVTYAQVSADGRRIFAGLHETAKIWDAATPGGALVLSTGEGLESVSFTSDGARVITVSHAKCRRVWDAANGKELRGDALTGTSATGIGESPRDTAITSPDGTRAVSFFQNVAQLHDVRTGGLVATLPHGAMVRSAMFSGDGIWLFTVTGNRVRAWSAATGKEAPFSLTHGAMITSASLSSDGARVLTASCDGSARVWDAATGEPIGEVMRHHGPVNAASFSSDGSMVATASSDMTARVWDAATGLPLTPPLLHRRRVIHAAFSPDGARIATASDDGTARVWESFADCDEPAPLLEMEAQLWTGFALDRGAARPLGAQEYARRGALRADAAARHAGECRYRAGNLWLQDSRARQQTRP